MASRGCTATTIAGRPCEATRLRDQEFCFFHAPDKVGELADAQRLGGLHRHKERTLATIYDLTGLHMPEGIRRLLELAVFETLGIDDPATRARLLIAGARAATGLYEVDGLEARLAAVEAALVHRRHDPSLPGLVDDAASFNGDE